MEPRPWYKKKRYLIPLGAFLLVSAAGLGGDAPTPAQVNVSAVTQAAAVTELATPGPAPVAQTQPTPKAQVAPAPSQAPSAGLSNDNTYTNVDGNTVHSPAYAPSIPVGATAQCRDGTYSFSQHRSGTCSHHGGVADWL